MPDEPVDDPVFRAPWEAKAFALAVELSRAGLFGWDEWAEALGREIAAAGAEDDGERYYEHWLRALERLVVEKGAASAAALTKTAAAWRQAAEETSHGRPITLESGEARVGDLD